MLGLILAALSGLIVGFIAAFRPWALLFGVMISGFFLFVGGFAGVGVFFFMLVLGCFIGTKIFG